MHNPINCIIVDDEAIARDIITAHISKIDSINILAQCSNAIEAFNCINTNKIDLIFLDINMPDISGISFAKSINKDIKIIFTTAYRDYAVEGFELQATDYLLKPISFERLLKAVNNFFETHIITKKPNTGTTPTNTFTFIRSDRKMIKLNFVDIVYIESCSDYVKFHLKNKTVTSRDTITAIEAKLPKEQFIRIHRSFIVSIKAISSFTNEYITINNKTLPISRSYKKEVLKRLEGF